MIHLCVCVRVLNSAFFYLFFSNFAFCLGSFMFFMSFLFFYKCFWYTNLLGCGNRISCLVAAAAAAATIIDMVCHGRVARAKMFTFFSNRQRNVKSNSDRTRETIAACTVNQCYEIFCFKISTTCSYNSRKISSIYFISKFLCSFSKNMMSTCFFLLF